MCLNQDEPCRNTLGPEAGIRGPQQSQNVPKAFRPPNPTTVTMANFRRKKEASLATRVDQPTSGPTSKRKLYATYKNKKKGRAVDEYWY